MSDNGKLIIGIILLFIGIPLLIAAIILCFAQNPIQLWTWLFLALGIVLILIGVFLIFFLKSSLFFKGPYDCCTYGECEMKND